MPWNASIFSKIAEIQLDLLRERLAEQHLNLEVSAAALKKLSDSGFDPVYGARPLKTRCSNLN